MTISGDFSMRFFFFSYLLTMQCWGSGFMDAYHILNETLFVYCNLKQKKKEEKTENKTNQTNKML